MKNMLKSTEQVRSFTPTFRYLFSALGAGAGIIVIGLLIAFAESGALFL